MSKPKTTKPKSNPKQCPATMRHGLQQIRCEQLTTDHLRRHSGAGYTWRAS